VKRKLLNIVLSLPEKRIINPHVSHIYSIYSSETEAVTMLKFKRCRDIERGVRD